MGKHNYNIFTKQELASFLEKYETNFRYISTPYDMMLDTKMDNVLKLIDKNLGKSQKATEEYERTKDGITYLKKHKKLHDEYQKLNKEYDRLSKLRFG